MLNTLPCTTVIYDCDGNPLFCNNKTYDLIAPNGLDLIPNLFESTIISSEHLTNAKEGKNVEGTAYLNFNDQRVEKIFGKNIERETVFKYHLESLVDSATKTTNYILSIYNITHQYISRTSRQPHNHLTTNPLQKRAKNRVFVPNLCLAKNKRVVFAIDCYENCHSPPLPAAPPPSHYSITATRPTFFILRNRHFYSWQAEH